MDKLLTQEKSIYLQIREIIESSILCGILLEEERAPSANELARHYTINPATAAKGLNMLVQEGVLYKKRGLGMFVATGAIERIRKRRRGLFIGQTIPKIVEEALELGFTRKEVARLIEKNGEEPPKL